MIIFKGRIILIYLNVIVCVTFDYYRTISATTYSVNVTIFFYSERNVFYFSTSLLTEILHIRIES